MSARIAVLLGVIALIGITVGGSTALGRSFVAEGAPLTSSLQVNSDRLPISVQGVITDDAGSPVADGGHQITFSIYDEPDAGTRLWQESQTAQTSGGLFSVLLGHGEQIDPSLFAANPETYLGIKVGENSELTPRLRLAYVPYAMHSLTAGDADTLAGPSPTDLAKVNHTHAQSGDGFGDSLGFFFSPLSPVTVDTSGKTGLHSSIAIGLDGFPIISYF